ncbi:unnamed protein product [Brassicogethes aeneus]|uniref:Uncharacterized protein n=1 Tax=Brassicogethes aeneus TaxID=1431903 RepID=A0A9P0BC13_BRAAE|nr:unnamed protein product [Brassicogethes aeneus]
MSKFKNRNIKTIPQHLIEEYYFSKANDSNLNEEDCFGESVKIQNSRSTLSSCDEKLESFIFCNDRVNNVSSSSSLSWSDLEFEDGGSKILEELKKIDRVLKRIDPVPSHYDKDEFKQWMDIFPNISIFDDVNTNPKSSLQAKYCDKPITNEAKPHTVIIKMNNTHDLEPTPTSRRFQSRFSGQKSIFTYSNNPKTINIKDYLKISPMKHKFIEKTQFFNGNTFTSLPFLNGEDRRNIFSSHCHGRTMEDKEKIKDNLILPPIINNKEFRSISATPRKPVKSNYFERNTFNYLTNSHKRKSHLHF